jgi:hypothetical protein
MSFRPPPSTPHTAPKEKGALGTRAFNLCGWAHLQPSKLKDLHQCNEGGWIHYNKASNRAEKEAVVDAYFVQPLVRKNRRFRQILTTEFRDLIITWRLALTNYEGLKPHGGLGTLSFVTRSLAEQENLEFYRTMNTLTENPTSADIKRTIPGTPKIPDNIDGPHHVTNLKPNCACPGHRRQSITSNRDSTTHRVFI